ncbi:PLEC protein, partial [Chloroceryle aenea]|nr:PLEC protein [Chloroceryle aenea]
RLERLQRVVTKLQMESGLCEEQLNQADALLQADMRLVAAGKPPQQAAAVERDLDKADAMIRLLFNDVQALKDGRHPQGEQMYRRYGCGHRLHNHCRALVLTTGLLVFPKTLMYLVVSLVSPLSPCVPRVPCAHPEPGGQWRPRGVNGGQWGRTCNSGEKCEEEDAGHGEEDFGEMCGEEDDEDMGRRIMLQPPLCPPQNSSKSRLRHLESLHSFVSAATKELLWLSEKEEEEVTFDWSH